MILYKVGDSSVVIIVIFYLGLIVCVPISLHSYSRSSLVFFLNWKIHFQEFVDIFQNLNKFLSVKNTNNINKYIFDFKLCPY